VPVHSSHMRLSSLGSPWSGVNRAYTAFRHLPTCRLCVSPLAAVEALPDLCAMIVEMGVIQLGVNDKSLLNGLVL